MRCKRHLKKEENHLYLCVAVSTNMYGIVTLISQLSDLTLSLMLRARQRAGAARRVWSSLLFYTVCVSFPCPLATTCMLVGCRCVSRCIPPRGMDPLDPQINPNFFLILNLKQKCETGPNPQSNTRRWGRAL